MTSSIHYRFCPDPTELISVCPHSDVVAITFGDGIEDVTIRFHPEHVDALRRAVEALNELAEKTAS